MGIRETGLLLMLLSYLIHLPPSPSPFHKSLVSAYPQENEVGGQGINEKLTAMEGGGHFVLVNRRGGVGVGGGHGGRFRASHGRGISRGGGVSSGNGGRTTGNGNSGGSGTTKSPYTPGTTTVIPIYAAGAANNRHHHHRNTGNSNCGHVGFTTLRAAILVLLVILLGSFWM